jgi:hypothetical protein
LYKGTDLSAPVEFKRPGEWRAWYKNNHGYIVRVRSNQSKQEFQLQHRKIMEDSLGRSLYEGENVHHKNGVRDDNRLENLELWVTKQPKGQRPEDLVEWAEEILSRYKK